MPSEHVAPSYAVHRLPASGSWRDDAWQSLVGRVDTLLRRFYGVYEFSPDPECVLRVGLAPARAEICLSDGTRIAPGEPVGICHFWNEHLPRFAARGPDLRWAKTVQRRMRLSLHQLALHIGDDPAWGEVKAVMGEPALARLRAYQMRRLALRYGFDMVPADSSGLKQLHELGENLLLWSFARAFNPAALRRHVFLRKRYELWMSRPALLARYTAPPDPLVPDLAPRWIR